MFSLFFKGVKISHLSPLGYDDLLFGYDAATRLINTLYCCRKTALLILFLDPLTYRIGVLWRQNFLALKSLGR